MSRVIAISNQKGGVGKTTTAYNIAAARAKLGELVLMIDMDPQYSLTESCAMQPDAPKYNGMSTCKLFENKTDPLDCCFSVEAIKSNKLFIVPSSQLLALTAKNLFAQTAGITIFKKNIKKLAKYFETIVIDCPPSLDELLTAALVSADEVIVPVKPERLSYAGLNLIMPTIDAIKKAPKSQLGNPDLEVKGIIVTMFRSVLNEHKTYLQKITEEYSVLGIVPLSAIVTKEVDRGLPVVTAHPLSTPAKVYTEISDRI